MHRRLVADVSRFLVACAAMPRVVVRLMHIGVLALDFHLAGCASLKEKRRRLARLRDRFGRATNLAVCESGFQDSHRRARWSVVAVAGDARVVERSLAEVEQWAALSVDATIVDVSREVVAA